VGEVNREVLVGRAKNRVSHLEEAA
jgi:hypothetical protein